MSTGSLHVFEVPAETLLAAVRRPYMDPADADIAPLLEGDDQIELAPTTMAFGGASEDIARTCHPHPTRSEAVRQAAMGVEGWTMQS